DGAAPLQGAADLDVDEGEEEDLEAGLVGGAHDLAHALVGEGGAGHRCDAVGADVVLAPGHDQRDVIGAGGGDLGQLLGHAGAVPVQGEGDALDLGSGVGGGLQTEERDEGERSHFLRGGLLVFCPLSLATASSTAWLRASLSASSMLCSSSRGRRVLPTSAMT